jgi:hypothetical protein
MPQEKNGKGRTLFLTFLLLFSIPIFVLGLLQDSSFDIRNRAFEEIEVSEQYPCVISFPSVNPYSLEVGKTFRVQVDAMTTSLGIQAISIKDSYNNDLLQENYSDSPSRITESFSFTPTVAKTYEMKGVMLDLNKKSYECVISSSYDIKGIRAITNNSRPEFTTSPKDSQPSQNIKTGQTYEYTLMADDKDGDTINYSYSFTPGAEWLKATVIEDGGNGRLAIKFRGSTETPASYLANVFIHDGYSTHLSSQSWVISVSPAENDNPVVTIIEPASPTRITTEDTLPVRWEAQDDNHIVKYELFVSSNPTNEKTWITIDNDIAYNQNSYTINTTELKDGTYRIIIRATDNQKPAGIGLGISEEIVIAKGQITGRSPDDQVLLPSPQIINISPTSTDAISNRRPTIRATLISSEGEKVDEESIVFKVDDQDITGEIKINRVSDTEYTVIYLPEHNLSTGMHKVEVSFNDTANMKASKDWTFTIEGEETDSEIFNIFGLTLSKRIVITVIGGIALILLAIFVPMIIFAVWRDDSEEYSDYNASLPPTIPEHNLPPAIPQEKEVEKLVTKEIEEPKSEIKAKEELPVAEQEVFQAPIPQQIAEEETTDSSIPEPTDDLAALLEQVEDIKKQEEDSKESE